MLKVSSRAHYGLRLMTELARSYGAGPLSLTEVARVEMLPLPYLEQLVVPLRKAGLVEGTRGLRGGYSLSQDPSTLTVATILRALEGPVSLVECTASDYLSGACAREGACSSQSIWWRIKEAVDAVIEGTTLAQLVHDPGFTVARRPAVATGFDGLEALPVTMGSSV